MASRTDDLPPVQRASKRLLGSRYRAEIAEWIWEFGTAPINPTTLTNSLAERSEDPPSHSSVAGELNKLLEAGVLTHMPTSTREAYYERVGSVYFASCHDLAEEVREASVLPSATGEEP